MIYYRNCPAVAFPAFSSALRQHGCSPATALARTKTRPIVITRAPITRKYNDRTILRTALRTLNARDAHFVTQMRQIDTMKLRSVVNRNPFDDPRLLWSWRNERSSCQLRASRRRLHLVCPTSRDLRAPGIGLSPDVNSRFHFDPCYAHFTRINETKE